MGGNIFPNLTRRFNRDEFIDLSQEVVGKLNNCDSLERAAIIPYYKNKESFEDLDILCELKADNHKTVKEIIKQVFDIDKVSVNDTCYSFPYMELQVDLILARPENFDITYHYYSYNDLGNLIGRVVKSCFDVKFGHKGLTAPIRIDNTHEVGDITISKDIGKILSFAGFNADHYFGGFDTLEQIFIYVTQSLYFDPAFFSLESLNHINRVRNRKRKSYMQFLEYLDKHFGAFTYMAHKPHYTVDSFFPESCFSQRKEKLVKKAEEYKKIRNRVLDAAKEVGLKDKKLGMAMQVFWGDNKITEIDTARQIDKYWDDEKLKKYFKDWLTSSDDELYLVHVEDS